MLFAGLFTWWLVVVVPFGPKSSQMHFACMTHTIVFEVLRREKLGLNRYEREVWERRWKRNRNIYVIKLRKCDLLCISVEKIMFSIEFRWNTVILLWPCFCHIAKWREKCLRLLGIQNWSATHLLHPVDIDPMSTKTCYFLRLNSRVILIFPWNLRSRY